MTEWSSLGPALVTGSAGASLPVWWKAVLYAGKFHPPVVHFPIALILVAAFLEVAGWRKPRSAPPGPLPTIAAVNLFIGTFTAVAAAALGWALAAGTGIEPELKTALFWHRGIGTTTALLAIVTVGAWFWQKRDLRDFPRWNYRILLLLTAAAVSATGFLGGILVNGWDYYQW